MRAVFFLLCLAMGGQGLSLPPVDNGTRPTKNASFESPYDRPYSRNTRPTGGSDQLPTALETALEDPGNEDYVVQKNSEGEDRAFYARGENGEVVRPWSGGVVPYEIGPALSGLRTQLTDRLATIQREVPCLSFVPRKAQASYMRFESDYGCKVDYFGQSQGKGRHNVYFCNKDSKGRTYGLMYHEILHGLGMMHEFLRPDRDDFLHLTQPNDVKYRYRTGWDAFNAGPICHDKVRDMTACKKHVLAKVVEFDIDSVMMYPHCNWHSQTENGCKDTPEIWYKRNMNYKKFGARYKWNPTMSLSKGDVSKLQYYYGCNAEINAKYAFVLKGCKSFNMSFAAGSTADRLYTPYYAGEYRMTGGDFLRYYMDSGRREFPVYVRAADPNFFCSIVNEVVSPKDQWMCSSLKHGGQYGGQRGNLFFVRQSDGVTRKVKMFNYNHDEDGKGMWLKDDETNRSVVIKCNDKDNKFDFPPHLKGVHWQY